MKEHVLSASDRAALQGLIPLAGALGAGTLFALFFGGRRKTGFAVFEVFAIIAVLAAVGTTAYLCIALLHDNEAISSHTLTKTAMPLIVAVFILMFVSIFSRLPGSLERVFAISPLVLGGAWVVAELASSSWNYRPGYASVAALLILAIGALLALIGWGVDRRHMRSSRNEQHKHFERLISAGYMPGEAVLRLDLPHPPDNLSVTALPCWRHKEKVYVDFATCKRLQGEVDSRWSDFSSNVGLPPTGGAILCQAKVSRWIPWVRTRRSVRLIVLISGRGGERQVYDLPETIDHLFDVTEITVPEPVSVEVA